MLFIWGHKTVAFLFVRTKEGKSQFSPCWGICIESWDLPVLSCSGYRCLFSHGGYHGF